MKGRYRFIDIMMFFLLLYFVNDLKWVLLDNVLTLPYYYIPEILLYGVIFLVFGASFSQICNESGDASLEMNAWYFFSPLYWLIILVVKLHAIFNVLGGGEYVDSIINKMDEIL